MCIFSLGVVATVIGFMIERISESLKVRPVSSLLSGTIAPRAGLEPDMEVHLLFFISTFLQNRNVAKVQINELR